MKTERLYAITVYLLNHGRTSASALAKHFEVSPRTIQRDIDSLCLAGVPVYAVPGTKGGYEIAERFRFDRHLADPQDYANIVTALRGLVSAADDGKAKRTLEKMENLFEEQDKSIILDFAVLREGEQETLQQLQRAVAEKRQVVFTYTNNNQETRSHCVEPVALIYRWYAWYLLAYSGFKKDYRMYKLIRMSGLLVTEKSFSKEHASPDEILRQNDRSDSRQYTEIYLRCKRAAIARVREYLKAVVEKEAERTGEPEKIEESGKTGESEKVEESEKIEEPEKIGESEKTGEPEKIGESEKTGKSEKMGVQISADAGSPKKGTVKRKEDDEVMMKAMVVENEQLWIGILLSLGGQVEVVAPERIRRRIKEAAKEIVLLYGEL